MNNTIQDTPTYGIVGNGRLARHFRHYFDLLNIPYQQWSRSNKQALEIALNQANTILLLISDHAIQDVAAAHEEFLQSRHTIHCSGNLNVPKVHGVHPLMSFGEALFDLTAYKQIPFIIEDGGPRFEDYFPQLSNPHAYIQPEQKALYHSLCVLSGNFTQILWGKFFHELEHTFSIAPKMAYPYLAQITQHLLTAKGESLNSGPLTRDDQQTIRDNLTALEGDPFQNVYQSFIQAYKKMGDQQ